MRFALPFMCLTTPVLAHPHIFVDTAVTVRVNEDGAVYAVEIVWTYDDFFSLLILEDLGLDGDGDLILTAEEKAVLTSIVLDWPADFGGDLLVETGGGAVALGPVKDHAAVYEEGRVIETHVRWLEVPAPAVEGVNLRVFDPGYYTAYALTGGAFLEAPEGCELWIVPADLDAAYSMVDELLYGRPASDVGPEEAFPEVGAAFADMITVTCPAG